MAAASLSTWLACSSSAQTVVTGGDPPTAISAADLETAGTLSFVQGDGTAGILQVTAPGTFTNSWSMNNAIGVFNLTGTSLTIASAVPHAGNIATGTCSIGVQGGTLTLGQNSFLTGFAGTFVVSGPGALVIEQADWFTSATSIELNSNAGTPALTWGGATAVTYAGALVLSTGATPGEAVISTTQDTGTLALTGAISGSSDLRLEHATGVTAAPVITLGLAGGFTGRTIIDGANVQIDTQASIGSAGLTIDGGTLTAGTVLAIDAAQALAVEGTSAMAGSGGPQTFTVDGSMSGTGTLALTDIAMTIGSGATSTFTGGITLDTGSSLAVANAVFVDQLGALQFDDAAAVEYSGTSAATFDGTLTLGANAAIRTSGASVGTLTLSGAVSGTGDLTLEHSAATADPTIVLALTGGFAGQTIVDTANVRIDTQESIGSTGLTLDLATLTAGTSLTIGASQNLVVADTSTIVGTGTGGALTTLAVDGEMQGGGALTLSGMAVTIGGATSTYTGAVGLRGGSTLTVSNAEWLTEATSLAMNADGSATALSYTGATAVTSGMALSVGTGVASISGTGPASSLTLTGTMSGAGTLSLSNIALAVDGAASTFTGGVRMETGSSLSVSNVAWLNGVSSMTFNAAATVDYTGATAASYDGALVLAGNATFRTSGAAAAALTLSGLASGTGNLELSRTGGATAGMTLALTGSFDGLTIVDGVDVTINTQGSVGLDGLVLDGSAAGGIDAEIGTALAFGNAQSLTVEGTVNLSGGTPTAAINAQGGLLSAASATLNLDDIDLTVGDGTASTFSGAISLTDGARLTLDGANLGSAGLSSVAGGAPVTFGGIGTIGSIAGPSGFDGRLELGDRGVSATSVLNVTGNAALAASSVLQSYFLSASGGTGVADALAVGGSFTAGSSTASLVFDPTVFDNSGGNWIPTPGVTDTYTVVSATGGLNGTFGTVNVVTIDPVTGLPTTRALNQSGETRFLGAGFTVGYTGTAFSVSILGIGGPDPLPVPGTTDTNVVVPVQVGGTTVNRNANVGVVQNQQVNQSAAAMNLLAQTSTGDTDFVATQLLLQTSPAAYASSVVAVSAPANPYALPTTLMLGMSEAGDLAMERLMQLRPQMTAPTAPPRQRGTGGPRSTAVAQSVATTRRKAFGAELNGPTPDEGMRGWARGFGFTGSFSNQNWAQTSYDSTLGNVAAGVDTVVGDGGILGGFVGYIPGSVSVTGGLVDESMTLNGVDFGMYGSWVPDRGEWYLSGAVTGAYTMIDRTRNIYVPGVVRTATSSSNAWSASFMGETGFNLPAGGDSYLSPYVRVAYNYFNQGSYTESGAGSLNLAVGSQSASALQPSVGARYMDGIRSGRSVITPFVGAAFTAFVPVGDWGVTATNPFTSLPPISVYGDVETLYGGSVEAGVELALPDGLTLFASFNGMFLSDTQVYGGRAGIQIPF